MDVPGQLMEKLRWSFSIFDDFYCFIGYIKKKIFLILNVC